MDSYLGLSQLWQVCETSYALFLWSTVSRRLPRSKTTARDLMARALVDTKVTRPEARVRPASLDSRTDLRMHVARVPPVTKEEAQVQQCYRAPPESSAEQHQFRLEVRRQLNELAMLALTARRARESALADSHDRKTATLKCMVQSTMPLR